MNRLRYATLVAALLVLLVAAMVAGVGIGSIGVSPYDTVTTVLHQIIPGLVEPTGPGYVHTVITTVRGPRVLLGAVVGAGLAVVGMTLQALVRNPLADPYLLGVSSGASTGAVAVIVSGAALSPVATPLAAFLGALAAIAVVYAIAKTSGQITTTGLVLAGVAVAYVLSALTSLLLLLASNANRARQVLTWLLGGLGDAHWRSLWLPLAALAIGLFVLVAKARALNLLFAGDESATAMGLAVGTFRVRLVVLTSLLTGVLVAVSGPIGFVGLIVPHAARMLAGSDHRRALPVAALLGASFLVLADIAARTVATPQEIPVGVLTALCGGPFFLWQIRRTARRRARAEA